MFSGDDFYGDEVTSGHSTVPRTMTTAELAARIWAAAQTLNAVADTEALSGAINDLLAVANDLRAMDQPTAHSGLYGTREHEDWLIQMEAQDVPDARPDQPYTPCGCTARAYGGDCAHTLAYEDEADYVCPTCVTMVEADHVCTEVPYVTEAQRLAEYEFSMDGGNFTSKGDRL